MTKETNIVTLLICVFGLTGCFRAYPPPHYLTIPVFQLAHPEYKDKIIVDMINDTTGLLYMRNYIPESWQPDLSSEGGNNYGLPTGFTPGHSFHSSDEDTLFSHVEATLLDDNCVCYLPFLSIGGYNPVMLDAEWSEYGELDKTKYFRPEINGSSDGITIEHHTRKAHVISKHPFQEIRLMNGENTFCYDHIWATDRKSLMDNVRKRLTRKDYKVVNRWQFWQSSGGNGENLGESRWPLTDGEYGCIFIHLEPTK